MAEIGIPIDQETVLTTRIQELEKKVSVLEHDNRRDRAALTAKQLELDKINYAWERAEEVFMTVLDRLLEKLDDR